jgi:hypothetical protein
MADDIHYDYSQGMYRLVEPHSIQYPKGHMWSGLNMVYDRGNTEPEKMRGTSRVGGTTDLAARVTGMFDHDEGTKLLVSSADGKFYETAALSTALSEVERGVGGAGAGFDTGTDTRWSGADFYGQVSGALMTVLCNGVDAPQKYTGSAMTALGGGAPALGKFPVQWLGRLWMVVGSVLHYSAVDDGEDWTNNGGSFAVDGRSGDITGTAVFMDHLFLFKRNRTFHIAPDSTIEGTSVWRVSGTVGCSSHYTIKEGSGISEGALYWMSDNGLQAMAPTDRSGGFRPVNISEPIKPIVDRRQKTTQSTSWALFDEDRSEYYCQYGTASSTPSEGVIANTSISKTRPRWTNHDYNKLTAGTQFLSSGEQVSVIGDSNGRIYQMHQGYDRNSSPYIGRFQSPSYAQGAPHYIKRYYRVFADVKANGNYAINVSLSLGRKGWPTPGGSAETLSDLGSSDGWSVGEWGVAKWGGSGTAGKWIRPTKVSRGANMRVQLQTSGTDDWFKVTGLIIEAQETARQIAA